MKLINIRVTLLNKFIANTLCMYECMVCSNKSRSYELKVSNADNKIEKKFKSTLHVIVLLIFIKGIQCCNCQGYALSGGNVSKYIHSRCAYLNRIAFEIELHSIASNERKKNEQRRKHKFVCIAFAFRLQQMHLVA